VLTNLGHQHAAELRFEDALRCYHDALPMVQALNLEAVVAEIKWGIGDAYRASGSVPKAIDAYREALIDYERLELLGAQALLRLVLAEALIEARSAQEAKWQILAALPTIERESMLPAGLAALSLLRESVSTQTPNIGALAEVRSHLQSKK
jgi:tetratricopeptide (TPR) repeat protein